MSLACSLESVVGTRSPQPGSAAMFSKQPAQNRQSFAALSLFGINAFEQAVLATWLNQAEATGQQQSSDMPHPTAQG